MAETKFKLDDAVFVIFGITGDLAKRKLIPAIYELACMDLLPAHFRIVAATRRNTLSSEVISDLARTLSELNVPVHQDILAKLETMISMVNMDIGNKDDYRLMKEELDRIDDEAGSQLNRLYYLAVPPQMFNVIVDSLGSFDLHKCEKNPKAESRLLIEKPFGRDTESAIKLINQMEKVFDEKSIYRVDHYLAKETAQNIMTFRFQNPLFKAVWDNKSIDYVMITAAEKIGIEGRVAFYEETGALRDLIQSHLLQLLALIAMEEPEEKTPDSIHEAKLAVLQSIKPISDGAVNERTVRGQYNSYKTEVDNPSSGTETFAAIRLDIENDRWRNVPFLLRTGKAMHEKITEITLVFKSRGQATDLNALTIRIQPDEGIVLSLQAKKPSLQSETELVHMQFFYRQSFNGKQPDSYERVLIDAIRGDKTLFTTDEEVLASWKIIENILLSWGKTTEGLEIYENGSWGPRQAEDLANNSGADWLTAYMPTSV